MKSIKDLLLSIPLSKMTRNYKKSNLNAFTNLLLFGIRPLDRSSIHYLSYCYWELAECPGSRSRPLIVDRKSEMKGALAKERSPTQPICLMQCKNISKNLLVDHIAIVDNSVEDSLRD